MNRHTQEEYFMTLARVASTRSNCVSRQVGCILVDRRDRVIATGYNGVPRGYPHCSEGSCPRLGAKSGEDLHKCLAIHAEQNALIMCSDPDRIVAAYITSSPCLTCMVMLMNTSCEHLIFDEIYDKKALEIWENFGRRWTCTHPHVPNAI